MVLKKNSERGRFADVVDCRRELARYAQAVFREDCRPKQARQRMSADDVGRSPAQWSSTASVCSVWALHSGRSTRAVPCAVLTTIHYKSRPLLWPSKTSAMIHFGSCIPN